MLKDDARVDGSSRAPREIDRRTIAKGVAWTVPVVIVATAAPAAAASGEVTLGAVSGMLHPATGAVTVSGTVNSTGNGNTITFVSVTRGTLPGTVVNKSQQLVSGGANGFSFDAPTTGGVLDTYTLTYSINGGSAQVQAFSVTSPTLYFDGSATRAAQTVTFTLTFTGDQASRISIKSVVPDAGTLSGAAALPTNEVLGTDLQVQFTQSRNQTGAKPTKATLTFTIDGGGEVHKEIAIP